MAVANSLLIEWVPVDDRSYVALSAMAMNIGGVIVYMVPFAMEYY